MLSLKSYEEAVAFARTTLDISVSRGKDGKRPLQTGGFRRGLRRRPVWVRFQETV